MIKYFIVPVDETEAHLLRQRFSVERQATVYEARFHAAYLLNTGKLKIYTYLDLAEAWGWQAHTPRSKQATKTAVGNALKNRVRRVIDYVSDPANSWTLLMNSVQSDAGVTPISRQSDSGVTTISHRTYKKQALTSVQSDAGVTPISRQSDSGVTIVHARGDALILNTVDARDQRSEIREEERTTPLPPQGGDPAQPVVTSRRKKPAALEPTEDIPAEFPGELRGRTDVPMLVKLWRDLKGTKARRNFLEVTRVWGAYKEAFPRVRLLGVKEYRSIEARIEEGRVADPPIPVDDICLVPAGVLLSPWHMGDNDSGKIYTSLESIFRDLDRVVKHIARARGEDGEQNSAPARDADPAAAPPPLVPVQRSLPLGPGSEDRRLKALLDYAGNRIQQSGMSAADISIFLWGLVQRHGAELVIRAITSWKDDPPEAGDDKSDLSLWLPAKCRQLSAQHT